jgi:hypothetical protein
MKWTLRGKGHTIASTWHEDPRAGLMEFDDHWSSSRLAKIGQSDILVVLAGSLHENASLAATAGIAVAHGIQVIWIGPIVEPLSHQRTLQHFNSIAEFYRHEESAQEGLLARREKSQAA